MAAQEKNEDRCNSFHSCVLTQPCFRHCGIHNIYCTSSRSYGSLYCTHGRQKGWPCLSGPSRELHWRQVGWARWVGGRRSPRDSLRGRQGWGQAHPAGDQLLLPALGLHHLHSIQCSPALNTSHYPFINVRPQGSPAPGAHTQGVWTSVRDV